MLVFMVGLILDVCVNTMMDVFGNLNGSKMAVTCYFVRGEDIVDLADLGNKDMQLDYDTDFNCHSIAGLKKTHINSSTNIDNFFVMLEKNMIQSKELLETSILFLNIFVEKNDESTRSDSV